MNYPADPPRMTSEDLALASYHLECAVEKMEQRRLSSFEISAKSLLNVLKRELEAKVQLATHGSRELVGAGR